MWDLLFYHFAGAMEYTNGREGTCRGGEELLNHGGDFRLSEYILVLRLLTCLHFHLRTSYTKLKQIIIMKICLDFQDMRQSTLLHIKNSFPANS